MTVQLVPEQKQAFDLAYQHIIRGEPITKIGGLAGTGKTTLLVEIVKYLTEVLKLRVAVAAFTGKAASRINVKMIAQKVRPAYCGTIHGLMYKYVPGKKGSYTFIRVAKSDMLYDIIIIDEASMVPYLIDKDIKTYNIPLLYMGDYGQLGPIQAPRYNYFRALDNLDFSLTSIHRQALDSNIIKLAHDVRAGIALPAALKEDDVRIMALRSSAGKAILRKAITKYAVQVGSFKILCGLNRTRVTYNKYFKLEKYKRLEDYNFKDPEVGDLVICLKNNQSIGIMNGQEGIIKGVVSLDDEFYFLKLRMDGRETESIYCLAPKQSFNCQTPSALEIPKLTKAGIKARLKRYAATVKFPDIERVDLFDYADALSVHKAQGSEWDNIILIAERTKYQTDEEYMRWIYTGITRAAKKLVFLQGGS